MGICDHRRSCTCGLGFHEPFIHFQMCALAHVCAPSVAEMPFRLRRRARCVRSLRGCCTFQVSMVERPPLCLGPPVAKPCPSCFLTDEPLLMDQPSFKSAVCLVFRVVLREGLPCGTELVTLDSCDVCSLLSGLTVVGELVLGSDGVTCACRSVSLLRKLLGLEVPVRKKIPPLKEGARKNAADRNVYLWLCFW